LIREKLIFKFPQTSNIPEWTPADLNGLVFWGDAASSGAYINAGSPTPGDQVSAWVDRSSLSNNAVQSVSTRQPLWQTDYLDYDGSNDFLDLNTVVGDLSTNTTGMWGGWFRPDVLRTQVNFSLCENLASAIDSISIGMNASGQVTGFAQKAGIAQWAFNTGSSTVSTSAYNHIVLVHNATTPKIYIDGVLQSPTFTNTTDLTYWVNAMPVKNNFGLMTFYRLGAVNYYDGRQGEFILCSNNNSEGDITNWYNYSKDIYQP